MDKIKFANIEFKGLTKKALLEESESLKFIITANAEIIMAANENKELKTILDQNYTTFDGQTPYLIAKLKNSKIPFEKISGSDFIYNICDYAKEHNKKIFLLGGFPKNNSKATEILKQRYNIEISGFPTPNRVYPFDREYNDTILKSISDFAPHFLLVGFGGIKQERWINDNLNSLKEIGCKWVMGVGGTYDVIAGDYKRAPKFIQKIGFEWLWRLIQDPSLARLKRFINSLKFFKYILS